MVSSTLGETEVGTWTNPNPSSVAGSPEVMSANDPKTPCTDMYFVEEAQGKTNSDLTSFKKKTKFEKMEDLFTHNKLNKKWRDSAYSSIDYCSKKKSTLYIGMGLSEQLAGVVSSEPFTKH